MRRPFATLACAAALSLALAPPLGSAERQVRLVWHVETLDGEAIDSRNPDERVNPASVVKIATTLWALERLGPDYRYTTSFAVRGELDAATGVLDGDLIVRGSDDPDFHVENAVLVAAELNRLGLREVLGHVRLQRFTMGWEGGSEAREDERGRRDEEMQDRLLRAFDPDRWDEGIRKTVGALRDRRGGTGTPFPRLLVHGNDGLGGDVATRTLVVHRSNPLRVILKRLNAFSNNDIERLEAPLGAPAEMAAFLAQRWGPDEPATEFETLSGLGRNRTTPRQMARLLRDLHATCQRLGMRLEDVLPVPGCDPGTLRRFRAFRRGRLSMGLTAKTGTLLSTDGGVAVLAGVVSTAQGPTVFAVAAPQNGVEVWRARDAQQQWLLDLVRSRGGAKAATCGAGVVYSDHDATVETNRDQVPHFNTGEGRDTDP